VSRGYFAVGIYRTKTEANVGTLWRSAHLYGAAFVFTVGRRYKHQASDTPKTIQHTPLFHFDDVTDLLDHLPHSAPLVGVELDPRATLLTEYQHRERAVYLLGAEDDGLPPSIVDLCHDVVQIPSLRPQSMNVATAGTVLLYDRHTKAMARTAVQS
jgi:tRNA G18 (ribose-2'-O)-methylase SpoU